jgi:transketolase
VARGAYVLEHGGDDPDVVLVGTGSEVSVCVEAARLLSDEDIVVRVVSMPCWDLFEDQDDDYQEAVLPADVPALSVEAASSFGWARWADASVSIDRFGESGPGGEVLEHLGINPQHVAAEARALLAAFEEDDDE